MNRQSGKIRRTDRQETDISFLHELLAGTHACSIAISTEQFPLIQNTFFVYNKEQDEIIFHFSKYGFAGQEILDNKKTTISIFKYGKFYTAEKAVDFGCEYQSIIIYGHIRVIEEEAERIQAMQLFFDKFFRHIPETEYRNFTSTEIKPIYIVKVKIEKWFGKQHLVPEKALASFYSAISPVI